MTDVHQTVAAAVGTLRPEIVAALQELVSIPSQTGQEGSAQEAVARLMRAHELEVDVWEPDVALLREHAESVTLDGGFDGRPNVVGVYRGNGRGRSLILNGHIDTVEVGDPAAWSYAPLSGDLIDGRLYGRGACDMKGGIVANLFAVRALRLAGFRPAGDIIVESTVSEEDGGAGALAAVMRGYVADGAIISEPTNLAIVTAQGGALMFRLQVPGLSAHACVRDEGVSAVEKFAYLHQGLLAFEDRRNHEIRHPLYAGKRIKAPINVGIVRSGSWASSVPESLVAEGRAGLVPGEDLSTFKIELAAEIERLAETDPWLRDHPPQLTWLNGQFSPADVEVGSPLVETLRRAWETTSSAPARIEGVTYGADMRHFVITGGVPCVMFGAGDVRLAHAPDEAIPVEDLLTAITTTALFIADWCGVS
ncbi:MAG TPA: ArgE/DapE family deacylase [Thermomicrobiales bacterium]|nr:ArgE/DapE family deacylase [Thermomicrobiales bacterium]